MKESTVRRIVCKAFAAAGSLEVRALERATREPRRAQLEHLKGIIRRNAGTVFGADHRFASIRSYEDFRAAVPVRDYEEYRPYIDRMVAGERRVLTGEDPFMFATTSGTTGKAKYIPVTEGYLREFRRASVASGFQLLRDFPAIPRRGVTLSIASPAEEWRTPGGAPAGAISGALFLRESPLFRRFISPVPYEVFLIRDYEARYYTLLRLALVLPLACFYTLNPSTIVMLVRRLRTYGQDLVRDVAEGALTGPATPSPALRQALARFLVPDRPRAQELQLLLDSDQFVPHRIWPGLQVVCCWTKAAASFYLSDFPEFFGPVPVRDITYGASEGRGTVYLGPDKQLLALRSHFFEFIPEDAAQNKNPPVLLADELEEGKNYFILFTTSGGLYRYHINDVVKVTGFYNQAPLLEFQYKGGNVCSFTGEKLTELHVTEAMAAALAELSARVRFFTVVPEFRPSPHYRLWVEAVPGDGAARLLDLIGESFDRQLGRVNIEYGAKRASGRLDPVAVEWLRGGAYERLRKALVASGIPDSQIKLSHLNPKAETRTQLENELIVGASAPG